MSRPVSVVSVAGSTVYDVGTGEVIAETGRHRLVRAYSKSVERVVADGMPHAKFKLIANRHGQITTAIGPINVTSLDVAFPECETAEHIEAADTALNRAGCTRGMSPAGRALDYAIRRNGDVAQWRATQEQLRTWSGALYGGIQIGGTDAPKPKRGRISMDINSSYPYLACGLLPQIRGVAFERGYRPGAVLVQVYGAQMDNAIFSRTETGDTAYREDFFGWYVAEEIDYHVAMGRVKVYEVKNSCTMARSDNYLAPTIDALFGHREKYQRGTPERAAVKSAMNGLLGKFASPVSPWRSPRDGELEELKRTRALVFMKLGAGSLVCDPSLSVLYPRHANVLWTALTYARARVRLWQKFDEITKAGGRVLWAHTDSVTADIPPSYVPTVGTALGDWRLISPDE